jgi:hypothetical protein
MAAICEKCHGVGTRAATTKSFEYEGQNLRCLAFVSSCTVCGHHWEDDTHAAENSLHVERACQAASSRNPIDTESFSDVEMVDDAYLRTTPY